MDVGIYALQESRMLTHEEPVSVSAQIPPKTDPVKFKDVEESMTFDLTFPSGIVSHCSTTYRAGINKFTATAERGSFGMEPAWNYNGNRGWRSDGKPLRFDEIDVFAAEMDDFAQCIMNGKPTKVPGEEGLRDVKIPHGALRLGAHQPAGQAVVARCGRARRVLARAQAPLYFANLSSLSCAAS